MGHIMEAFGEVNIGLTVLDPCGVYGLVLVAEQVIRNETFDEGVTMRGQVKGGLLGSWVPS